MTSKILKYFYSKSWLIIPVLFFSSFVVTSCSHKNEISKEKFIKVYCDLLIAQDTLKTSNEKTRQEVFKRYSVTSAEYDSTISYYNSDPKRWDKFFDEAIDYLQSLRAEKKN